MRRFSASVLATLIVAVTFSLVASTSSAAYLRTLGPKDCCRSTCHRGQATTDTDANRCCSTHLGVLPSALGPTSNDFQHVVTTLGAVVPTPFAVVAPAVVALAPPTVMLRGSPPGSLVAAAVQLLI